MLSRVPPPTAVSAGTASASGTVVFSNSNGLTFGLNGSTVTGSYTVPTVPAQISAGLSNLGNTAGDTGVVTGRLVIVGTNNITLSGSTNGGSATISISGGAGAAGNTGYVSAGANTASLGTVAFSNSNGVSFGANGQTVTASHNGITSQTNQTVGGYFVGNTTGQSSSSTADARSLSFDGAGIVSAGWSNGSVRISATQSNQAFSAAGGSSAFQTLSFDNANGATFSNVGGAVRLSYTVPAAQTGISGVEVSNATFTSGTVTFRNANGISFGSSGANGVSASYTVPSTAGLVSFVNLSAGTTSNNSSAFTFSDSNGVSFGLNAGTLTASHNGLTSQSNQAFSADASSTFQTLSFQNSNGVSFSNNAGALRVTHDLQFTSATSAITSNALHSSASRVINVVAATNNTGGGTASLSSNVSFSAANGATFYTSAGNAVALSYTVPTVPAQISAGASTGGNTAGDTGLVTGRLVLVGGNNVTLSGSTNGGSATLTISGGVGGGNFSAGLSNLGNTAGDTGITGTRLVFAGGNNITLSQATDANGATVTVSAPNLGAGAMSVGASNLGNTAGSTGITGTQFVLVGTGVVSLSQSTGANGGTLSVAVPATSSLSATGAFSISTNGSTVSMGVGPVSAFAVGNTTLSTSGSQDLRQLSYAGSGAASVGVSNGSVVVSCPNRYTFSQYPFQPVPLATSSAYSGSTTTTAGGSRTAASWYVAPFVVDEYVAFDQVFANLSWNTVAGTGSVTAGHMWGLYTDNAGTLSSVSSWMFNARLSQSSVTAHSQYYYWGTNSTSNSYSANGNISASLQGLRAAVVATGGGTLTPGQYWLAYGWTMNTGGAAVGSFSNMHVSFSQSTLGSIIGTNVSSTAYPFHGIFSATTSGAAAHVNILPASIHSTAITGTGGSSQNRSNVLHFANL